MKTNNFFSLISLLSLILLSSCGKDLSKIIVGKWAVNDIYIRNINEIYDKFQAEHRTNLEFDAFEDSIKQKLNIYCMDFFADKSFAFCKSDNKGTWQIQDGVINIDLDEGYQIDVQKIATDDLLIAHFYFKRFGMDIDSQVVLGRLE